MTRLFACLKERLWDAPNGRCDLHKIPLEGNPISAFSIPRCDLCTQERMEALELQDQKEYERKLRHEARVYAEEIAKAFNR